MNAVHKLTHISGQLRKNKILIRKWENLSDHGKVFISKNIFDQLNNIILTKSKAYL